jgi:hypothetical protein
MSWLFHQQHRPAALDFARDLSMHMRRHTGHAARKNFAAFSHELLQKIGVLIINRFGCDIDATPWHRAIGTAKCGTAFGSLRLHSIISFRDEACAASGTDCIFSFRADWACADFSYSAKSYSAKPERQPLSPRCIPV